MHEIDFKEIGSSSVPKFYVLSITYLFIGETDHWLINFKEHFLVFLFCRVESTKGAYAGEWVKWEKQLREVLLGNAEYLNSIQVNCQSYCIYSRNPGYENYLFRIVMEQKWLPSSL